MIIYHYYIFKFIKRIKIIYIAEYKLFNEHNTNFSKTIKKLYLYKMGNINGSREFNPEIKDDPDHHYLDLIDRCSIQRKTNQYHYKIKNNILPSNIYTFGTTVVEKVKLGLLVNRGEFTEFNILIIGDPSSGTMSAKAQEFRIRCTKIDNATVDVQIWERNVTARCVQQHQLKEWETHHWDITGSWYTKRSEKQNRGFTSQEIQNIKHDIRNLL